MDKAAAAAAKDGACLKVAILNYEPYWNVRGEAPSYRVTGVMPVIYDILAQHLDFCYEYVVPSDLMYGSLLANGTVTGQVGLVNRTEAALSGVLSYTSNRASAVDFSEPLYIDQISVAYRRPVLQSDILAFFRPFTLTMWMLVMLSTILIFLVTCLVLWSTTALYSPRRSREEKGAEVASLSPSLLASAERSLMWTLSVLLAEAFPWTPRGLGVRVVCGVWLVAALIVGTVYRSNLKAMLILPKVDLPFDTLDQLVDTKIPVYIIPSSAIYRAIMDSPPESSMARVKPQLLPETNQLKFLADTFAGRGAVAFVLIRLLSLMNSNFAKTGECGIYVMSERMLQGTSQSLIFPKGSPLKPKFDKAIHGLKEFGILNYQLQSAIPHSKECIKPITGVATGSSALRPLDLGDFYGVFSILLTGMLLAGLIFVVELLCRPKRSSLVDPTMLSVQDLS